MAVRRAVVAVVLAGGAVLDLQGRMVDAEALVERQVDPIDEGIVVVSVRADQVRGHRDLAGPQRPDMQVVDGADAGLPRKEIAHRLLVDRARHGVHGGVEALAQQAERAGRDHQPDQQCDHRIQPGPTQPQHAGAREYRGK